MILYHGSNMIIDKPITTKSRESVDFGKGFYTTDIKSQAIDWTKKVRSLGEDGIVSIYELDDDIFLDKSINIKNFDSYSKEWLHYVTSCRKEEIVPFYDVIIGSMADDRVYNSIELYINGFISEDEALKRLSFPIENRQICFRSQNVIDKYLKYKGCEKYAGK